MVRGRGGRGGGWGGYDKHTRSALNCCRPACSVTGLQNNMVLGGGGVGWGHEKHTRSTAADAFFTPEAFTGPTFGSRTMGHFVLALCVAYVLLLRVACAPCPIVDSWSQAFWTCDPFLLDAHFEVFAGSSDPFAHFAASVSAISAPIPLSSSRQPQETHVCWPAARSAAIFARGHNVRLCMTWKQMKAARSIRGALRSCIEKKRRPAASRNARVLASSAKCCYSQAIWPFLVKAMVKMEQNKHGACQRCNEMFIKRRNFGKRAWSPWSKAAWSLATP